MSVSSRRQLLTKISELNNLQDKLEAQQANLEDIVRRLSNIGSTLVALDELAKRKKSKFEGFIALGSDVFIRGKIEVDKEKILQEIGAGVSLSLNLEKTQTRLEKRREDLRDKINQKQGQLSEIVKRIQKLRSEIRNLRQQIQY
ncbi:MAG: prefoldin subunit alpha [Candidatus Korarchaeota archaeon]|nr:prefoldin subunit alpha [Candidatus Korarchaeota archaeon]NIU82541.1 prefoldin subunit alpha [Candidatus Thorarchaeota archaeon]NIW13029.1 prefoldin subunit alpha [Candidatus Thorarchaeota archaeon]NIW51204.1 prefoldin subunit alpha [Candidatus Korarchaeota archaeon]